MNINVKHVVQFNMGQSHVLFANLDTRVTTLAHTPIKIDVLSQYLDRYDHPDAESIRLGFLEGFSLQSAAPPLSYVAKNHMSALEHPDILKEKVQKEITLGRIVGPFKEPPLPFLRCSPVGLVPKKPDDPSDPLEKPKFRFIHDLSTFPK